ncbi:hypothetical protein Tco_1477528 [Tanacetum coccineum]
MPPRRTPVATARAAAARAVVAAAAAAPMTVAAIEQLIEARVSAALANHETLQNSTNGHGDGSHNFDTGIRGTVRNPLFHISNCAMENQVKFATCTFLGNVLTWMFHEESEEVKKYVGGLPDMIRGNVMSYQPKTMEKAIEFASNGYSQKDKNKAKTGQNRARDWTERGKPKPKAYVS